MQITVQAEDKGFPVKSGDTQVEVEVTRNEHSPEFEDDSYEVSVSQELPLNTRVLTLTADDKDTYVSSR